MGINGISERDGSVTTKQMDYILELAQTLNFNRAAENLFVSQPTMTYQINAAEEEIGFRIFERSGKGAALTPAGNQFVTELRSIRSHLKKAIEQGQNFSMKYTEDIRIAMPIRSAVYFLPQAISRFSAANPSISISPYFDWNSCVDSFLRGEQDILFAMEDDVRQIPDIVRHPLFESRIYLITEKNDPLAGKIPLLPADLAGRTLMVGGGSPRVLQKVQQRVIHETGVDYFNSHDHDTTLTNVASHRGVCLAPGFLNDHNGEFAWTILDCDEVIPCVLCTHKNDKRKSVAEFVKTLQRLYQVAADFEP